MKSKIFATFFVFCVTFFAIAIFDNFANILHFFSLWNTPEIQYNKALSLAKKNYFSDAQEILPQNVDGFEARLQELKWDIFYELEYPLDEVITEYETSLQYEENQRLREKIAFLKNQKNGEKSENQESDKNDNQEEQVQLEEAEQKISEDQEKRGEYLNAFRASQASYQQDLEKIKTLLSDGEVSIEKDW